MRSPLCIRPAVVADVEQVSAIEAASFPTPWSAALLRQEMTRGAGSYFFVVESVDEENPRVVAYGCLWLIVDECHIVDLAVDPGCRRQGLGALCVAHGIRHALSLGIRRITLEVRATNEAALQMYEKLGFLSVARRKNYYLAEGLDAVVMWIADASRPDVQGSLRQVIDRWPGVL